MFDSFSNGIRGSLSYPTFSKPIPCLTAPSGHDPTYLLGILRLDIKKVWIFFHTFLMSG